jgi:hypothetical protein
VTNIGAAAFGECTGLTSLVIPNSVTSIGVMAFGLCKGLTSIVIPDSVTIIEEGTFFECSGLISVVIPESVRTINGAFDGCDSLEQVIAPARFHHLFRRAAILAGMNK